MFDHWVAVRCCGPLGVAVELCQYRLQGKPEVLMCSGLPSACPLAHTKDSQCKPLARTERRAAAASSSMPSVGLVGVLPFGVFAFRFGFGGCCARTKSCPKMRPGTCSGPEQISGALWGPLPPFLPEMSPRICSGLEQIPGLISGRNDSNGPRRAPGICSGPEQVPGLPPAN